ncbi:hypothetical protein COCC4DRAFT_197031 [Bipolaris maydis ATCC 48331]|uniref:Uncharacterized protein n=3 Tax=Cochliobolus heterostrophus TaxID=5016 RepID=M2UYV9_COCH5|nr:uncharacterized protein COCC4DRAFT_197031 [Bipolaris maydis ATCC 48331]EMD92917.1 hypothetical protein COCHEDRAFT_1223639 [Bipolaris maydis C5]KAH7558980.1 hypothetical protein BM1_05117 [Bipolaris maydis]ENI04697.1 hypothetical protein COCC4DRAFT_197031 [Bipolaris maydis ATCC 48331]KAJ6196141.1 hypothetical protein J3E72DRAFT_245417 [Bipolaris maydis]KAJ6208237.1 hypothetical protein PSV09DRAFT_1223639 [Bipolaris maydis]
MAPHPEIAADALSPMAVNALQQAKSLAKRDDPYTQLASAGAKPPLDLAGPGFQALFALIGIGMAFMAIWFFFWAKNGGFKWREGDWEDYKSTVLRRKGPDGKTLSNATKSTRLGGGSVVHGGSYFGAQSDLGYTDESGTTVTSSTYPDAEKGEAGLRGGDGRKHKKHRRNHTNDYSDPELRQYREEKAARVGGLNRVGDGKYTDYSGSQPSEVGGSQVSSNVPLVKKEAKEPKDPKKEAKAKEQRAKERMRKAKAAEKEAAKKEAAEAKARKEEQKAEAKRLKDEQKRSRKNGTPSEAPEMAEVSRPMIEYHPAESEYTRAYTEYTAPSVVDTTPTRAPTRTSKGPNGPRRAPPSAAYSFTTGDDTETVYTGVNTNDPDSPSAKAPTKAPAKTSRTAPTEVTESSYYSDYRPNADPSLYTDPNKHAPRSRSARPSTDRGDRSSRSARPSSSSRPRPSGSRSRPPSESSRKQHRSSRPAPPPSDIFTTTNGDAHGHMSYPCHIPGLSQAGSVHPMESVSQVGVPTNRRERGGRDVMDGYRRGGVRAVGRRDSLSDSD